MTLTAAAPSPVSRARARSLDRWLHRAQHRVLAAVLEPLVELNAHLIRSNLPPAPAGARRAWRRRFDELVARDWACVEQGLYPRELLFQMPVGEYVARSPRLLLDGPLLLRRARARKHDDLPAGVDRAGYPAYFTRNFHWQTGGWFSDHSARLWDLQLEVFFGGAGDMMRRMLIAPLVRAFGPHGRPRVLDVGCGTGRFLLQLHRAMPDALLTGLDLGPAYVAHARKVLADVPGATVLEQNAEGTTLPDGHFDAVTLWGVLHEMPRDVRRTVLREIRRVLKPGGLLAISDVVQCTSAADMDGFGHYIERHSDVYHEPYYASYLRDPLGALYTECGFTFEGTEPAFIMEVATGRKAR
jgi:ubiquinone/menaquinone biosynthesis C-methylase UbiE